MGGSFFQPDRQTQQKGTTNGDHRNHGGNGNPGRLQRGGHGGNRRRDGRVTTMATTTNVQTSDWQAARARVSASKWMADPMDVATLWEHNRNVTERWMADYGRRTGKSRVEIIAERQANWRHDARAHVIGVFDGFRLSACPHDGRWRYTVVTAWGMSEGLCDMAMRDDARAIAYLSQVTSCL